MIDPSLIYTQNRRMDAIAKAVGVDSEIYLREKYKIERSIPPEFTRTVNGVLHMVKPAKMEQAGVTYGDIPTIKSWRDIRSGYRQGWKDFRQKTGQDMSLNEYIQQQVDLIGDMPLLYGNSEKAQQGLAIMQIRGRRKTWQEIGEVIKIQGELKND